MAKKFRNLLQEMPSHRVEKIEEQAQSMLLEMALQDLRQARQLTQQQIAEILQINQAALSKMENQSDMHVSTLRRILSAMGAELKIVAQFPNEEIVINQFS